ncbi:MAG TPA: chromosome segregation protein SMC, partial [Gammaproteobacteria bacterium]|nr:chromosome segregation protein SMC [Gammaproteobacteria bacterium]
MRLSKIKLAGFKSFVDPTTIHLPSNLMGIVGPNGCGKSNVIDAVRWVMGESSAKSLRGESMADVIFNGSTSRKPVSQASIELVFDNSDGGLGGQYAEYAEISVKRHVSRDGQSSYFLNGTRCRRRDITDIFLGTGLGPHSYAIIEQNMISRLVEAKPDDLRIFLEEAAGISKYKERRRETETRIKHTRENLDRVNDVREELGKQLERLQRQANVAEKYKLLKQQERQVKAELLALRWRALISEAAAQEQHIQEQETALEGKIAEQRALEAAIEKRRAQQTDVNEAFNAVQGRFYSVGAEIARLEQAIAHAKDRQRQQQQDLEQVEQSWRELQAHLESDNKQIADISAELRQAEPDWETACQVEQISSAALAQAEQAMQAWQTEWEAFNQRANQSVQAAQVERTRLHHLEQQLQQLEARRARLTDEAGTLSPVALEQEIAQLQEQHSDHERQGQQLQETMQGLVQQITELRQRQQQVSSDLDERRSHMERQRGRYASLEALQQAALGKRQGAVSTWLEQQGLQDTPRLAQHLQVDKDWERAVECVLGFHLEAVCVEGLEGVAALAHDLQQGSLGLFDTNAVQIPITASRSDIPRLQNKVQSPWALDSVFAHVFAVETLPEALALTKQLAAHESVITRDGMWLGNGWLRISRDADERAGVLGREHELKELQAELHQLTTQVADAQHQLDEARGQLHSLEQQRDTTQ